MSLAVHTEQLTKRFGPFVAVDALDLEVAAGEVFGFLGSNGAGKSTAIRMLCGLLAPTSGRATVLGIDVAREPERVKRAIGYMSQRFSLYLDLTPRQNLTFFGGVYGLSGRDLDERVRWAIGVSELSGREDAPTADLPPGWRQRLALSCAVLHRPRLVFLDEPTGGVDPISRREFWKVIEEMAAEGVTLVVTTHYLDEAEHCRQLALMHAGKLIAHGTLTDMRALLDDRALYQVRSPRVLDAVSWLRARQGVLDAQLFGSRLHVVVPAGDPAAGAHLRDALDAAGFGPARVDPIRPTLEDVFIQAIESAEANGTVGAAP